MTSIRTIQVCVSLILGPIPSSQYFKVFHAVYGIDELGLDLGVGLGLPIYYSSLITLLSSVIMDILRI